MRGRRTIDVLNARIGLALEQQANHRHVVFDAGRYQRSHALLVLNVEIHSGVSAEAYELNVTVGRG
eukprot:CAMPEP_0117611312 /NCGR_PEP_ID=MMETSP0784-20121206/82324_1 /TAXON_ID=39447 /ORGANISM="" /LENGTH=65 /DNA_ID=CAMNT_0005414743 /DNA_START=132 /DNA_END=325 /DNA_ORIENTATION=-